MFKNNLLIALIAVVTVASLYADATNWQAIKPASLEPEKKSATATNWQSIKPAALETAEKPRCNDQISCKNNPKCQCYCSVKCGPRDKVPGKDQPIWVENDELGHHCYCRDRDWNLRNQCPIEKGVLNSAQ